MRTGTGMHFVWLENHLKLVSVELARVLCGSRSRAKCFGGLLKNKRKSLCFFSQAMTAAVCGFEHSVWAVRNSSMMLFASIMQRAVGGAKNVGPSNPNPRERLVCAQQFDSGSAEACNVILGCVAGNGQTPWATTPVPYFRAITPRAITPELPRSIA